MSLRISVYRANIIIENILCEKESKFPRLPQRSLVSPFYLLSVFSSLFQKFHNYFFVMKRRLDSTLIKCTVAIEEVTKYLVQ